MSACISERTNQRKQTIKLKEKNTPSKARRNFYIREDLDAKLNELSNRTELSKSELVDKALLHLFENLELE